MTPITANDPLSKSADLIGANVAKLRELFPEAFTEDGLNFDVLKQLLGGAVAEGQEKYGLNWHGKRAARQHALTPSVGTLRPAPADSVDWDSTQNLMIEGDNLEVLKLLQKSYSGKVKLIYIDPPYNTGNDFVYPDNFRNPIDNYKRETGQIDTNGHTTSNEAEKHGGRHTKWLNMLHPRLALARNLLREDGVIFVSIDDHEVLHLRMLMNDVFGEENFVEAFVWKRSYGGGAREKYAVGQHEYAVMYARSIDHLPELSLPPNPEVEKKYYKYTDSKQATRGPYRLQPLEAGKSLTERKNLVFSIPKPGGGEVQPKRRWLWSRERVMLALENDELVFSEKDGEVTVSYKQYLISDDGAKRAAKPASVIEGIYTQHGTQQLLDLFEGDQPFTYPKPSALIRLLLQTSGTAEDDLVLDFFAGSATTAQAALELNCEDGGKRRFIMVQLPEPTNIKKYPTIAEITKERLRRAGKKVKADAPLFAGDVGFRVYKLDTSNIRPWNPTPDDLPGAIQYHTDHQGPRILNC